MATTVGVRFPDEQLAALDREAKRLGLDRSSFVRLAVAYGLPPERKFTAKEAAPHREPARAKRSDAGKPREFNGPFPKGGTKRGA